MRKGADQANYIIIFSKNIMWKYMDTLESRVNITCTYTNSNESNDSRHACCVSNDVYTELSDSLYGPGHLAYLK